MTQTLRRITAVLLLALLTACGFHLRGKGDTAGFAYPQVYVEGGGGTAEQLRSYLPLLDGIKVSKTPVENATAKVVIIGEKVDNIVLTINSSGQATEYKVVLTVSFSAFRPDATALMTDQKVTLSRSYSYDPNNPIAMNGESDRLVRDMQQDAVQLILRRINAVAARDKANAQ
ncbi:LPS-assembly lipoprotein LptE [Amantichitinum ursilacus]|uniref:LPS-assembly lipoprotein LptE n=1 Tax=Amantichitinum ursilacus TaxID=857265 RepID=A0A0N0XGH0_9NEIS|nr:LPS assembly lipoprotein LptE [Amantichitinum ursilacus]KPC50092.1 LPS-assembly lipoprotein RlpB [Amantichitinum ursilacus]